MNEAESGGMESLTWEIEGRFFRILR